MEAKTISWLGQIDGVGSYPDVSRQMIRNLKERGYTVLENMHNDGGPLADASVTCQYPPPPLRIKHGLDVCISTWEFHGPNSTPDSFLRAFEGYDIIWAKCKHAAMSFLDSGVPKEKVKIGQLGVNYDPINPDVSVRFPAPELARIMLMVGGSDLRHGIDIALATLEMLPENYWLVWKVTPGYPIPEQWRNKPRLVIVDDDAPSLAPYYRYTDLLFYPVRAVGPGRPIQEALAYGLPVITTSMVATHELAVVPAPYDKAILDYIKFVPGEYGPMHHHIHSDCFPNWWQAKPRDFARAIEDLPEGRIPEAIAKSYRNHWSWDNAVNNLVSVMSAHGF